MDETKDKSYVNDRHNNNRTIKSVPRVTPISLYTNANVLQNHFNKENYHEDTVYSFQDVCCLVRNRGPIYAQRDRIAHDNHRNEMIEPLVSHQFIGISLTQN